jgi:predicted aspartyl protease
MSHATWAVVAVVLALWAAYAVGAEQRVRAAAGQTVVVPTRLSESPGYTGRISLPIHYSKKYGIFMVTVRLSPNFGRPIDCVMDTGSRHLCVSRREAGRYGRPARRGPKQLRYGTQSDDVVWEETTVRLGSHDLRNMAIAVSDARHGNPSFNVFGLSVNMKDAAATGAVPFLRQLAGPVNERPTFCIEMRHRTGGMLHINHACAGRNRMRLVRGVHWYLTPLVDVRIGGVPVAGAAGVRYCMFDTGSNMLGSSPHVHDALVAALRRAPGSDLEIRLQREDNTIYTYTIPPSTYTWTDGRTLLLDPHEIGREDVLILGSLVMLGRTIHVDPDDHLLTIA